jgi:UDP-3-O-[3-hydroxymyristoyl] N-acetylglucosamine deacetylase
VQFVKMSGLISGGERSERFLLVSAHAVTSLQRTIAGRVILEGTGLHSGLPGRIHVSPAPANAGIVFVVNGRSVRIPARTDSVLDSNYATTLGCAGYRVQTVEHLIAAAAGLGIDNLEIAVEGPEIPAMDGSAGPFVELLHSAGEAVLAERRRPLVIQRIVRVGTDGRWLQIIPSDTFRISYTLESAHPAVGTQVFSCTPTADFFASEVAPARTYGFLHDVGELRRRGLALGGSLANAVVIGKRSVLNSLRFPDEFVRHKVLDLIGDLALLGRPVIGHVIARNAGHALNVDLVAAIERAHPTGERGATNGHEPGQVDLANARGFAAL